MIKPSVQSFDIPEVAFADAYRWDGRRYVLLEMVWGHAAIGRRCLA